VPIVELHAAPMLTKFGRKSRPWFKVVDWRRGGDGAPSSNGGTLPRLEHQSNAAADTAQALDDEIPF
jgi:hypothetical protein